MERTQPTGVFVVGVLTVLAALGLLFFALILSGQANEASYNVTIALVFLVGDGILLLVDGAFIFLGVRTGYFLSIILWVLTLSVDAWFVLILVHAVILLALPLLALPFSPFFYYALYCVVSFGYFLTHNVRNYFGT